MQHGEKAGATTLERIAELAHVSRSTVSRVLNDDPHVKPTTRERVLAVVEQEGYEPNRAARSLASGRTGMLGVVVSVDLAHLFSDPFFATLIRELYRASRRNELVVSLWLLEDEQDRKTINQITRGSLLDGAIVAAGRTDDPIVQALAATDKPFVLLGHPVNGANLSYVDIDNEAASRAMTNHLLRLGRRRIATIAGPQFSVAAIDRRAGYRAALAAAGIDPDPGLEFESDYSAPSAVAGVERLLPHHPDAIVAANDVMAIAAIGELAERGLRVPEDVAVVGFDDLAIAARATPPLTTVRQSITLLATEAVRAVSELIEDPSIPPRQVVIPTELIVRASCGANLTSKESKGER